MSYRLQTANGHNSITEDRGAVASKSLDASILLKTLSSDYVGMSLNKSIWAHSNVL